MPRALFAAAGVGVEWTGEWGRASLAYVVAAAETCGGRARAGAGRAPHSARPHGALGMNEFYRKPAHLQGFKESRGVGYNT